MALRAMAGSVDAHHIDLVIVRSQGITQLQCLCARGCIGFKPQTKKVQVVAAVIDKKAPDGELGLRIEQAQKIRLAEILIIALT